MVSSHPYDAHTTDWTDDTQLISIWFKVQGSCLFVTYTIIQGMISSEMKVRTGPLNGQCKKTKIEDET